MTCCPRQSCTGPQKRPQESIGKVGCIVDHLGVFASARTLWARAFLRTPYAVRAPFLFRLLKRAESWTDPVPLQAPTVDLSLSLLARLASGGLIFLITITCSCALLYRFLPSSHPGYINACICCYKPHHNFGIRSPFRLCTLSIYEVVSAYENSLRRARKCFLWYTSIQSRPIFVSSRGLDIAPSLCVG